MARRDRFLLPLLVVSLSALIAACGSSATPSPSPAPTAAPTEAPTPTAAPATPEAAASAPVATTASSEPSVALPSDLGSFGALLHGDPALESALPDAIGGNQLQKVSFKGNSSMLGAANQGSGMQELQGALGQLGKSMSDLGIAIAGSEAVTVGAYQISGIDANAVWSAMQSAFAQAGQNAEISDVSISGKSAKKVISKDSSTPVYLYPHGDVLYFVTADSDALLNAAFASLP